MNPVDTHLSTFINGDLGYEAPEYMSTLVAALKGDVYSFGVVLLELVIRQKPIEVTDVQEELIESMKKMKELQFRKKRFCW